MVIAGKSPSVAPQIDELALVNALDAMIHPSVSSGGNLLVDLFLVDEAMMDPKLLETSLTRSYVLSSILTAMIKYELLRLRRALDVQDSEPETSQTDALEAITRDVRTGCPQLVAWSWLYYHYVRLDLNITVEIFCKFASIRSRTATRYRRWATRQLLLQLIEKERDARKRRHQRFLYAQLPPRSPVTLIGRDSMLDQLIHFALYDDPCHVQIVGASGVGKTALIRRSIQLLIDRGALDNLVWLDTPRSVDEISSTARAVSAEQGSKADP